MIRLSILRRNRLPFLDQARERCRTRHKRQTGPSSPPSRPAWVNSATGVTRSTPLQVRRRRYGPRPQQTSARARVPLSPGDRNSADSLGLPSDEPHSALPDRVALDLVRARRAPTCPVAHLRPHLAQDHAPRRGRQRSLALHRRRRLDRGPSHPRERDRRTVRCFHPAQGKQGIPFFRSRGTDGTLPTRSYGMWQGQAQSKGSAKDAGKDALAKKDVAGTSRSGHLVAWSALHNTEAASAVVEKLGQSSCPKKKK